MRLILFSVYLSPVEICNAKVFYFKQREFLNEMSYLANIICVESMIEN